MAAIDISRLSTPPVIERLSFEPLFEEFKTQFLAEWGARRAVDPSLPEYDVINLETSVAAILGQANSYVRLLDRQRVNDGIKGLLAPLAKDGNLDAIVAARNIERLVAVPGTGGAAALMEGDAALLRRYLLSFDAPAAGSVGRYLFDAWSAWPQSEDRAFGLWDAKVNGHAVHGRRGDTDVVIIGPFGRLPTTDEIAAVRGSVTDANRAPEAVAISVMPATRIEYSVSLVVEVAGTGPVVEIVRNEAIARVQAAAVERTAIGGEVPPGLLAGAAYGPGVVRVRDLAPVTVEPSPYVVPVMSSLIIAAEARP